MLQMMKSKTTIFLKITFTLDLLMRLLLFLQTS